MQIALELQSCILLGITDFMIMLDGFSNMLPKSAPLHVLAYVSLVILTMPFAVAHPVFQNRSGSLGLGGHQSPVREPRAAHQPFKCPTNHIFLEEDYDCHICGPCGEGSLPYTDCVKKWNLHASDSCLFGTVPSTTSSTTKTPSTTTTTSSTTKTPSTTKTSSTNPMTPSATPQTPSSIHTKELDDEIDLTVSKSMEYNNDIIYILCTIIAVLLALVAWLTYRLCKVNPQRSFVKNIQGLCTQESRHQDNDNGNNTTGENDQLLSVPSSSEDSERRSSNNASHTEDCIRLPIQQCEETGTKPGCHPIDGSQYQDHTSGATKATPTGNKPPKSSSQESFSTDSMAASDDTENWTQNIQEVFHDVDLGVPLTELSKEAEDLLNKKLDNDDKIWALLAEKFGIDKNHITHIEKGQNQKDPMKQVLSKLNETRTDLKLKTLVEALWKKHQGKLLEELADLLRSEQKGAIHSSA